MLKNITAVILGLFLLLGCSTKPIYLKNDVYQPFELDASLLETKKIPTPPEKIYFINLNNSARLNSLVEYSLALQSTIVLLNSQLEEIKIVLTKHNEQLKVLNNPRKESYE